MCVHVCCVCIYCLGGSLSFFIHLIWDIFGLYFFKCFCCYILSSHSFWNYDYTYIRPLDIFHRSSSVYFFQMFFSLFFRLDHFHLSLPKITNLFSIIYNLLLGQCSNFLKIVYFPLLEFSLILLKFLVSSFMTSILSFKFLKVLTISVSTKHHTGSHQEWFPATDIF